MGSIDNICVFSPQCLCAETAQGEPESSEPRERLEPNQHHKQGPAGDLSTYEQTSNVRKTTRINAYWAQSVLYCCYPSDRFVESTANRPVMRYSHVYSDTIPHSQPQRSAVSKLARQSLESQKRLIGGGDSRSQSAMATPGERDDAAIWTILISLQTPLQIPRSIPILVQIPIPLPILVQIPTSLQISLSIPIPLPIPLPILLPIPIPPPIPISIKIRTLLPIQVSTDEYISGLWQWEVLIVRCHFQKSVQNADISL